MAKQSVIKLGINGFGRIGKCVFLQLLNNPKFSICALNATNIKIDHRNYSHSDKKQSSLLVEKIKKNNNNFDQGINELIEEIIMNEKLINICIKLENYKKITDNRGWN